VSYENKAWLIVTQNNFQTSTSSPLEIVKQVNSKWKGVTGVLRFQQAFEKILHWRQLKGTESPQNGIFLWINNSREWKGSYNLMVINVKWDHNPNFIFQITGSILLTTQQRDLGVTMMIYPLIKYCMQCCSLYPKEGNFTKEG